MSNFLTSEALAASIDGAFRDTLSTVLFDRSVWTATTKDKQAQDMLANLTGADPKALRTSKYLFEGTKRHNAVLTASRAVYTAHENMTRSLGSLGLRVIPNGAIGDYIATLDPLIAKHDAAVQDFVANYAQEKAVGIQHLGSLGYDELYPDPAKIPALFSISYNFAAMMDKSVLPGLDQATVTRLQMNLERSMKERVHVMLSDTIEDFKRSLRALHERVVGRLAVLDGDPNRVRLTGSVITEPYRQAQLLRRLGAGDWAERMGKIEAFLGQLSEMKDLSNDADKLAKVRDALGNLLKMVL
jgi:hypothetical protein